MNYIVVRNNECIPVSSIPVLDYKAFTETNAIDLIRNETHHCVNYFGFPYNNKIRLICCIANDEEHNIYISSCEIGKDEKLQSFTSYSLVFEKFEREIHENFGIQFTGHPWLKPVRFPQDLTGFQNLLGQNKTIANYPFFKIDGDELHEVGVGPIHAGIIEPGHFRFICNGEQIMHLEIQLGYQHRGIERLMTEKKKLLQRITLAESIAGDTVAGHTIAFVNLWESLAGFNPSKELQYNRTLALELERIAIHTGDLSALCTDVAYQLGSAVFGRLRTPIINHFQSWCGNRFAKGLIRAGKNLYPYNAELAKELEEILNHFEKDFEEMINVMTNLPSVLARFERTGVVTIEQVKQIGTVGMSARMSGLIRDIRSSHPHDLYSELNHQPIIKRHGDVYSRVQIRRDEIRQSIKYIRQLLESTVHSPQSTEVRELRINANSFAISLVEGWRGEICHCAITDEKGEILHYKIKDPSFHNWLALGLAVRNNEISDFPVCNKSFNLSYCGHDL